MNGAVPGIPRGCGTRQQGGIYAETGLAPEGVLIEFYFIDPPKPYEIEHKVGVELVELDGVTHVMDWIGEGHYPYVADFIEEVRNFGLSRRLPRSLDFSKLDHRSKIICVHARAIITNRFDWTQEEVPESLCGLLCRAGTDYHIEQPNEMCSRHWYTAPPTIEGTGYREGPSFTYSVWPPPENVLEPEYRPGIFGMFPLTRICVIESEDGSHLDTVTSITDQGLFSGRWDGARVAIVSSQSFPTT